MKKVIIIIAVLAGFFAVLAFGVLVGGGITYLALRARPVLAADLNHQTIQISSNIDRDQGILVSSVDSGSPAEQAGIVRGDIIIAVNDVSLNNLNDLMKELSDFEAGDEITLTVLHGDEERQISISLTDTDNLASIGIVSCQSMGLPFIGDKLGQGLTLPFGNTQGVIVQEVLANTPAESAGLQPEDVILAVDGTEITQGSDFASLIAEYKPGDKLTLTIQRAENEESLEIDVVLGEHPDDSTRPYLGIRYQPTAGFMFKSDGDTPLDQLPFEIPEDGSLAPFFGQQPHNFSLPEGVEQAVLVVEVVPGTAAEEAGILTNDLITELNGQAVEDPDSFVKTVQSLKPGDEVELTIYHAGEVEPVQLTVILGENPDAEGQPYLGVGISGFMQVESETTPGQDSFFGPDFQFPFPDFEPPVFEAPGESA